ncbi:AraC family transcriptional regulator [Tatumella saanichensis]|uniref:AraC family transcriptional regulator n=1 Tax=Tatumella saanichensis TaxID=480813 RepID=UPI0004A29910|nr:helix-turn-helix transcriptional regulator [Tatumella saanichensis]
MRNVRINDVEQIPRSVIALATDYTPGTQLAPHHHRRAQFLYSMSGLMEVTTGDGQWMVLPGSGVWIPAGTCHSVRMLAASTRSLYIESQQVPRPAQQCEVLSVSPLLHQLLLASAEITLLYDPVGRDALLLELALAELARAPVNPLFTPLPADPALAALCGHFLQQPTIQQRPEHWAAQLHKSLRTFSRFFRQQTGLAFSHWRQRACVNYSLVALSQGESVTRLALTLGYQNSSAFSAMFRQATGFAPTTLTAPSRG